MGCLLHFLAHFSGGLVVRLLALCAAALWVTLVFIVSWKIGWLFGPLLYRVLY